MSAIGWAKEHPGLAVGGGIAVILVVMLATGGSKSDATGGGSQAVAAYYGAVANQAQAGAAIQMAQIQANAGTNQALIAASYGIEKERLGAASTDLATTLNAQNVASAISSNERVTIFQTETAHAISDNTIALQNAALHSNEIIAGIQSHTAIKTHQKSFGDQLGSVLGGIGGVVKSVAPFGLV